VPTILVPAARVVRWFENFATRHGDYRLSCNGRLVAEAGDGARAVAALPFGRRFEGATPEQLAEQAVEPVRWGLLLVRRGGFAVAAGTSATPDLKKVGRRHVQGRTKAGGWSQQRFARRRDKQAREAFEAAADHAARVLLAEFGGVEVLVCGGDRAAVQQVLDDHRLAPLRERVVSPWVAVPDPDARALDKAVADAWSCVVTIEEPMAHGAADITADNRTKP
jgi:hypothetical protein